MKDRDRKAWRDVAEAALSSMPPDFDFGDKLWQLREAAFQLGVQPESLRKYIAVHQFVSQLAERQPERAAYLWSLPVVAAEAFKRWAVRDSAAALAAMKRAQNNRQTSRQIIEDERRSRNDVAYALYWRKPALDALADANRHSLQRIRKGGDLRPRIPYVFEIDPSSMRSPSDQSALAWCGVDWLARGEPHLLTVNSGQSQQVPSDLVTPSVDDQRKHLDCKLAIINVPESLDRSSYAKQAEAVITKAILASRFAFLVLVNLPHQDAWDAFVEFAPVIGDSRSDPASLRMLALNDSTHAGPGNRPDFDLTNKAWLASYVFGGDVLVAHPGIWHRVMFAPV
jgi:hypothetical protein